MFHILQLLYLKKLHTFYFKILYIRETKIRYMTPEAKTFKPTRFLPSKNDYCCIVFIFFNSMLYRKQFKFRKRKQFKLQNHNFNKCKSLNRIFFRDLIPSLWKRHRVVKFMQLSFKNTCYIFHLFG